MFVKLYSRITESSLMEQPVEVRYTFLMLLAIADPTGRVVGTDIAIARRLNVPVEDFVKSVKQLSEPDPDSNSKEEDGRRIVPSDGERGYQLVNFQKYRNLKDEDEKREYMRGYMKKWRAEKASVKSCKPVLNELAKVTQAEAEAEAEQEEEKKTPAPAGQVATEDLSDLSLAGEENSSNLEAPHAKRASEDQPPSSAHPPSRQGQFQKQFIDAWFEAFKLARGEDYDLVNRGKDFAAIKRLSSTGRTVDDLIATAKAAWAKRTAPNWHCQKAVSIAYFSGFLNEIRAELGSTSTHQHTSQPILQSRAMKI